MANSVSISSSAQLYVDEHVDPEVTSHHRGFYPLYEMDGGPLSDDTIFAIRNTPDKQDYPTIKFNNTLFKSGQTGE